MIVIVKMFIFVKIVNKDIQIVAIIQVNMVVLFVIHKCVRILLDLYL